ncbi:MAG: hypothetical protein ABS73_09585 [Paracoccus sp. SCN 68-21]|nr:MAG: hypothetical protein ABS73_09585 [Paracoccus sp. SCN 68-21]
MAPLHLRGAGRGQDGLLQRRLDAGLHLGGDGGGAIGRAGPAGARTAARSLRTRLTLGGLALGRLSLGRLALGRFVRSGLGRRRGLALRGWLTGRDRRAGLGMGSGFRVLGGHALTPPVMLILFAPSYISAGNSSSTDPMPGS